MAENNVIISAEEEAKLLKPIDEYVGKIQAQIDALRVEGSDKVNSLKNQIAIAKENKNLTKEQQNKIIEESKKQLEKAKATEAANKEQITKLIADAEGYLSKHYSSEYYDIVAKSCEAEKKAENSSFEKTKTQIQDIRYCKELCIFHNWCNDTQSNKDQNNYNIQTILIQELCHIECIFVIFNFLCLFLSKCVF